MAYYDPQQQAQVANIFAAQYGVQREAREDEKKERRTGMVAGAKAGYFLDRGYIQDQRNKAADMMLEKSGRTDTDLKYRRKAYKKPESWKEWLSQRYATPLGTGRRGALLEEEGYKDTDPEIQKQIKQTTEEYRLGPSGKVGHISNPDTRLGEFDIEQHKARLEADTIIHRGQQQKKDRKDIWQKSQFVDQDKQIAERNEWIEQLKIKEIQSEDFGLGGGTGSPAEGFPRNVSEEALRTQQAQAASGSATATARLESLEGTKQQAVQDLEGYRFNTEPLTRYKTGGPRGPKVGDIEPYPASDRHRSDLMSRVSTTIGGGQPYGGLPRARDTSYNELVRYDSETANQNVIQDRWKFGKKANPFGMDPTKGPSEIPSVPSPVSDPGSGVASILQNYGANIEKEQLTEWIGAGGSEMPGKSNLGKYLNWQKTAEVPGATDAASTITDEAGEEISGASGLSTGLKVGATLLGSQGQTSQELANTGLETGLDVASSYGLKTGIATGNVPLVAISAGYKLFDFLGGSELFT